MSPELAPLDILLKSDMHGLQLKQMKTLLSLGARAEEPIIAKNKKAYDDALKEIDKEKAEKK